MRNRLLIGLIVFFVTGYSSAQPPTIGINRISRTTFIENKGQIIDQNYKPNPAVLYLLNTPGMNVQLRRGGFSYDLYRISNNEQRTSNIEHQTSNIEYHRIDFDLIGSNPNCEIITTGTSSDYTNYYTTGTPVEGVTNVHSYKTVTYKNIYPGIDLQFISSDEIPFKYNFVVYSGGRIDDIRIEISGPEKVKKVRDILRCETTIGEVDESIPKCFYKANDLEIPVDGRFYRITEHVYGFRVDQELQAGAILFIDPIPTRRWGTYYGGPETESIYQSSCVLDSAGNIFICGYTTSLSNISTIGAFQTVPLGVGNAFLVKFTPTGQRLWGTYYGGTVFTDAHSCAADNDGNVFMVGRTASTTVIATPGAYQTMLRGLEDGFIVKFTGSGSRLWGTYYGGNEDPITGDDWLVVCSTDSSGNLYGAGWTNSPDFIASPGCLQPNPGGKKDNYLVKFTPGGQREWGTYYGGSEWEINPYTVTSNSGFVYLSGSTSSSNNIATPGSFMPTYNGIMKAFLACFTPDGNRQWGTYFGGEGSDGGYGCTSDTGSSVYLFGYAESTTNIATPGVFLENISGVNNGFLEKFSSSGTRLWGSYLGPLCPYGGAVDDSGFVFLAGQMNGTDSLCFSPGAYQPFCRGNTDATLTKLSGTGQRVWGTYYGGISFEGGVACTVDHNDHIYLLGETISVNNFNPDTSYCSRDPLANYIATPGAHQNYYAGSTYDAFLVQFADCYSPDTAAQIYGPPALCQNTSGVVFSIDPLVTVTSYQWCVTGNLTITSGQGTTSIMVDVGPALGTDTISVYGINACDTGFPKVITRRVNLRPNPAIIGTDTTCTGASNLFTTLGGMNNYIWDISAGGSIVAGGTISDSSCNIVWTTPGSHWVRLNYTDTNGCEGMTPVQHDIWVVAGDTVDVSIFSSANPVCAGTSVTFTATSLNGGLTPMYQWKVNGVNVGINSPVFTYIPASLDLVSCILTSSEVCTMSNPDTSNSITMIVNPLLPVDVSISSTANPVCDGIPVTFTATPVNGGSSPLYQWQVNGVNAGTNNMVYSYFPVSGDLVSCILTSSETICVTNNPDTSNVISMTVIPSPAVDVTVIATPSPSCQGILVTFTATPVNGGSNPSYQWQVNSINIGTNSPVYAYIPALGDSVRCILTSNLACATNNPASGIWHHVSISPAPIVSFPTCFDTITTLNAKPINLKGGIPLGGTYSGPGVNPVTGVFTPSTAGTGNKTITYTYTNAALCSASKTRIILVIAAPAFTCGNNLVDIRDNKMYPTVLIGGQCWMAANLDFGVQISELTHQRDNCISEKYTSYVPALSSFYQWDEIMRYDPIPASQGLCPPGWHIPAEAEWGTLFANWTNNAFAASPLKYSGYSGFNALLSGARHENVQWNYQIFAVFFWSSTAHGPYKAWAHGMNDYDPSVSFYPSLRSNAFSVRCLRD